MAGLGGGASLTIGTNFFFRFGFDFGSAIEYVHMNICGCLGGEKHSYVIPSPTAAGQNASRK